MSIVYLVRHAQAEGNLYCRFHGWHNGQVTPRGMEQLALLEERFRSIPLDAVYSSDLKRAVTTARAAARPNRLPVIPDAGLREINMGIYDDTPYGELAATRPELYDAFVRLSPLWGAEGGETFLQVAKRASETLFSIIDSNPAGSRIAVFSHGMTISCLQAALRGKTPDQFSNGLCPNTGVSCYEFSGGRMRIHYENDASHLPPAAVHPLPPLVRFRAMDPDAEGECYRRARIDGWLSAHADLVDFDGPGFLDEARDRLLWDPRSLQCAVLDGEIVGLVQLDTLRDVNENAGHISFLWVRADMRKKGIGGQLIGQAASTYSIMGRRVLRLQCAPANLPAQSFYREHGFAVTGQVPGAHGTLDLLEKDL